MGYYIQTSGTHGKADEIAERFHGTVHTVPPSFDDAEAQGLGIIVVMDNGIFEAAGFAYDRNEYSAFTDPADPRPKLYVLIPREDAERESGFRR